MNESPLAVLWITPEDHGMLGLIKDHWGWLHIRQVPQSLCVFLYAQYVPNLLSIGGWAGGLFVSRLKVLRAHYCLE